jgi:DNA replication protein DnaC
MTENAETTDSSFKSFLAKKQAVRSKEELERVAKDMAAWDALPENEKKRIIALRKQKHLEREKMQAEKELQELHRKWLSRGVTQRFFNATWENWKFDTPEQELVLKKVKQAWEKNLFITGMYGTGKTHLAMCLAKDGASYCLIPELFRAVRDDLSSEQIVIDNLGSCRLLILDEAGRQKGTSFEHNLLFEIIDKRWNNMLPTTIIGNINKREFANLYGAGTLDRLQPETIEFNWESRRQG